MKKCNLQFSPLSLPIDVNNLYMPMPRHKMIDEGDERGARVRRMTHIVRSEITSAESDSIETNL